MVMMMFKGRDLNEMELLDEISDVVEIGRPTIKECYYQAYQYKDSLIPEYLLSSK